MNLPNHDSEGKHIPQAGEGLHGETMGAPQLEPGVRRAVEQTASQDGGEPNTPEANLPPLEYASGEPTKGAGERETTVYKSASFLEGLPEELSTRELVKYSMGGQ